MFLTSATTLAAVLAVSPGDGRLGFTLESSLHTVEGQSLAFNGQLDTSALTGSLQVDVSGLTTGLGPRDARMNHICLEAQRFPAISLVVTDIDGSTTGMRAGAGAGAVQLVGTLTIRDVTKDVNVAATYAWEGDSLHLQGRHTLRWADWNIPDPSTLLSTVSPELVVTFDVVARPSS